MEKSKKESSKKKAVQGTDKKSKETALTAQQEKFVYGVFSNLSQREAYRQAYRCDNMKESTMDSEACRLMKNQKIATRLEDLRKKQQVMLDNRELASKIRIIKELEEIAYARVDDFLNIEDGKLFVGLSKKTGRPQYVKQKVVDIRTMAEMTPSKISAIESVKQGANGIELKMHGKIEALKLLGMEQGMFKQKVDANVDGSIAVELAGEIKEWSK